MVTRVVTGNISGEATNPLGNILREAMRQMTSGSSMLAMILTAPPQCSQRSISMPKTRLRRCAQLIAACFGTALPCPSSDPPRPRLPGTICARKR